MIQEVAKALGDLKDEVIFVGGATVSCYLNLAVAPEVRPTEDIDVVIEIFSSAEYQKLSNKLLKMNFSPDLTKGAPLCRWKYLGMTIDIMPLDEKVIGFSSKFYKEGIKNKASYKLPNDENIFILPIGLFLASKLEAFNNRGADPRFSKDLEDIVAVLCDAENFDFIYNEESVLDYLRNEFSKLLSDSNIKEAIKGFIEGSVEKQFQLIERRALLAE